MTSQTESWKRAQGKLQNMITVMKIPLHPWDMTETLAQIVQNLDNGRFTQHTVVNVAKLVNMQTDPLLRDAVLACDIINIDGMGLVWGARLLGFNVPERVPGIDLFEKLLEIASDRRVSVFFLGARPEVLNKTVEKVRSRFPGLIIAGCHHGYFWDYEREVVDAIRSSKASLLFVGITSPKKELFINRWRHELGVRFAMGVGGSFDIMAGVTKRAPKWMQRAGLEWLYRVIQEPRRMWKRYLVTNSKFLFMLAKEKLFK
jgi:N-acetylglucosaminyldiphosphoundecaprenol N-acetyl-beta-D-mannosaminyltransferase